MNTYGQKTGCLGLLLASFLMFSLSGCSLTGVQWNSQFYIVKSQDTLYSIAWRYSLDYKRVAAWNEIKAPYTIYPGQRLLLSDAAYKKQQSQTRVADNRAVTHTQIQHIKKPARVLEPVKEERVSTWQWPTQGSLNKKFTGRKSGSQGIDIGGELGQAVSAAANGKVVYSGEGLVGYGQLIIIKHNETYLSAYAHNRRLLVQEGENVRMGQKIAEMGSSNGQNGQIAQLHFEIRKLGAPVDPMKYLPRL